MPGARSAIAVVVKGYPRLSETSSRRRSRGSSGVASGLTVVSLRHPTDRAVHELHRQIAAPVIYLPEYLYHEPGRGAGGLAPGAALADLSGRAAAVAARCAPGLPGGPNRARRFGQALVLAAELPEDVGLLYAHYLHTPASVTRYAEAPGGLAVVLLGARQGHLDHARRGAASEARGLPLGDGLHGRQRRASAGRSRQTPR